MRIPPAIAIAIGTLLGCGGSDGASGDWYYHWDCHGDPQCLATNPSGTPTGTLDEGPVQVNCTELMDFARHFWGSVATNSCDHSPTGGGSPDGGGPNPTSAPTVGYVTPDGAPGAVVSISGTNFPSSASAVTVTIGGTPATVGTITSTNINVTVPSLNAGTYSLVVTTSAGSSTWPRFVVDALHVPSGLVVDATSVYWLEQDGSVKKVPIGGGSVTALATNQGHPHALAQDSSNLYWTDQEGGAVKQIAKGGGAVSTLASGLQSPECIAVDGSNVYWIENGITSVRKIAKAGGPIATLTTNATGTALAVNDSGVYYFGANQVVYKAGLSGGSAVFEGLMDMGPVIVLDATQLYFGRTALHRALLSNGTVTTYTSTPGFAGGLAVDAANLYYVNIPQDATVQTSQIESVPLGDGAVKVIVSASGAGHDLAVDGTSVYWTESLTSSIKKAPKGGGTVVTLATSPNVP
jgi:hypothetical protein